MHDARSGKMSVATISMIIVVSTFGIVNVIDNLVALGLAAIPSWIAVGFIYFLPMALILAEFASDTTHSGGGIYSYMERGLGPFWAFVGTWSYFVANLVYLQTVMSRIPIRVSLAVTGHDAFETATILLPFMALALCLGLTFLSTRGVRVFSRIASWAGRSYLVLTASLIAVPIFFLILGRSSATPFTLDATIPSLDLQYFSTFSWLLFAVAGAEVAAPYVKESKDPQRSFPRAILITTILIALLYVLGTVAVSFVMPLESLTKATGIYDVWIYWSGLVGLPAGIVARFSMILIVLVSITATVVWMESPVRAMFAEVPKGTFPGRLTRHDASGTHRQALWIQAAVVIVLILIPLISIVTGTTGTESFISLLNDLSSLSLVVPYIFIALAYIQARRKGMNAPFQMTRSKNLAISVGILFLVVSAFGYFGAGLHALQADPVDWIYVAVVYGGPIALILLGLVLRAVSLRARARS